MDQNNFLNDMCVQHSPATRLRFRRLNLNIGFPPPSLDEKAEYPLLHKAVKDNVAKIGDKIMRLRSALLLARFTLRERAR
jgi:hypothetical protein